MCNYMGHRVTRLEYIRLKEIEKLYGVLAALDELQIMRSGFVYDNWKVLVASDDHSSFDVVSMHWEFIPGWIKDMEAMKEQRKKTTFLNAKSENLFINEKGQKAMWADAARKRRCLVPMGHFFEWRHYKPDGEKKEIAYPYLIELPEKEYFFAAGIWNEWTDKSTGEVMKTFAIVTTAANELMAQIHNKKMRQPSILTEDLAWDWIMKKDPTDAEISAIARYQIPSEQMSAYTLAKDFRTAADPLAAFEYDELPPLDVAI